MKLGGVGSPVQFHQDWAYYPYSNDDGLAIGVAIDDIDALNGAMQVVPVRASPRLPAERVSFSETE